MSSIDSVGCAYIPFAGNGWQGFRFELVSSVVLIVAISVLTFAGQIVYDTYKTEVDRFVRRYRAGDTKRANCWAMIVRIAPNIGGFEARGLLPTFIRTDYLHEWPDRIYYSSSDPRRAGS